MLIVRTPHGWERVPTDGRVPELRLGLKRLDERAPAILEYVPVPGTRQPHHRTEEFPFRAASIRSLRN